MEYKLVILDTSFLTGLFLPRNKYHGEAKEQFTSSECLCKFVLTDYVVDETMTLIRARKDNCDIAMTVARAIQTLIGRKVLTYCHIHEKDFLSALSIFKKYCDKGLSFMDATILYLFRKFKADEIYSYDRNLLRIANAL